MKTPISTSLLLPILAAATLLTLTACSDYDNGYTEQQLNFIRDFKNIYGDIDPTQDWNLAERASVTVTTTSPSNIKIYARYDSRYTLVANYTNVSGTQTLGFDIIEGTNDVLVSDGQMAYKAKVGESVEFGKGTRHVNIIEEGKREDGITVSLIPEGGITLDVDGTTTNFPQYKDIKIEDYSAFLSELPEIGWKSERTETNLDKVENNFRYTSQGSFVIYPYYFVTSSKNEIGLYYYKKKYTKDDNKADCLEYIPIYTMMDNELQYSDDGGQTWIDVNGPTEALYKGNKSFRGQGILVNIPEGKVFGMYLKQYLRKDTDGEEIDVEKIDYENDFYKDTDTPSDGTATSYILYSESYLNDDRTDKGQGNGIKKMENGKVVDDPDINPCYAATFESSSERLKGQMFLAFEDWRNRWNDSDFDFNDVVFAFDGATPIIIPEDEVQSWIISAEDLGNTYDIDYNDVVLEVQYISGQTQANIIPLAAGGTLPVHIYFGDATTESIGEIHQLLGGTQKSTGLYTPINVSGPTPKTKYKSATRQNTAQTTYTDDGILITVPENFSLASSLVGKDYHTTTAPNMGGFRIEVTYTDGTNSQKQTIQNTTTEGTDNVPYVICTPKTYKDDQKQERHYRWPQESRPMFPTGTFTDADAAYNNAPDGQKFIDWVKDKRKATEWYKYPNRKATCAPQ